MNINLMCRWPSAVHFFEDPQKEVERIIHYAMDILVHELGSIRPTDFDHNTTVHLEKMVEDGVRPLLPLNGQLLVSCNFAQPTLMVIDVTQAPSLHTNSGGLLH